MRRVLAALAVALTLTSSVMAWAPARAGVRSPIGAKGLWWGDVQGIAIDAHGDAYVTGSEGRRNPHVIVRRYARGGGSIWERTFRQQGDYRFTYGRDVAVGRDGTVYVTGVMSIPTMEGGNPSVATFLRAYGSAGALKWQRVSSIPGFPDPVPTAVAAGPGFVMVTGYTSSFESVEHEGWIRAWSPRGRPLWYDDFEFSGIADEERDEPTDVVVDREGSIYVVGVVDRLDDEYGGTAPSDSEVVVRRMTSSGGTLWTRILSDRSKDADLAMSVAVREGRVLVGAVFGADTAAPRPWVRSYTTSGRAVWTRVWPGGAEWFEDLDVGVGPLGRVHVVWSGGHGVHVKALTSQGWPRWRSAVRAEGVVAMAVHDHVLRVTAGGPTCCHAKLFTYRA